MTRKSGKQNSSVRGSHRTRITSDRIKPYADRPQKLRGVTVLSRQPAWLPHPHPSQGRRLVETRGVTQVLLESGDELFECDICGHIAENARSVLSHLPTHNPGKSSPIYSEIVLRQICLYAAYERSVSHRGYAQRVVARLVEQGVSTIDGRPWTDARVLVVWGRYHREFGPTARQLATFTAAARRSRRSSESESESESTVNAPASTQTESPVRSTESRRPRPASRGHLPPPAPSVQEQVNRAVTEISNAAQSLTATPPLTPARLLDSITSRQRRAEVELRALAQDVITLRHLLRKNPPADPETLRKAAQFDAIMTQARAQIDPS